LLFASGAGLMAEAHPAVSREGIPLANVGSPFLFYRREVAR